MQARLKPLAGAALLAVLLHALLLHGSVGPSHPATPTPHWTVRLLPAPATAVAPAAPPSAQAQTSGLEKRPAALPTPQPAPGSGHNTEQAHSAPDILPMTESTPVAGLSSGVASGFQRVAAVLPNPQVRPVHEPEASASPAAWPARVAPPAQLRFAVQAQSKGLRYPAQAELSWQRQGLHYEARWSVQAFLLGSRVQTSSGELGPQGLVPLRFAEKIRSEQAAHFERDKGRISFSANTPEAPLLPYAQDRLSVLLQLGAWLEAAPERYPPGREIAVPTTSARDSDLWTFVLQASERLALPAGDFDTVKLVRAPRHPYDLQVELWLARTWHHLPVRLRLTQSNGDVVDQQLSSIEISGEAAPGMATEVQ